jgi:hypothetical protein
LISARPAIFEKIPFVNSVFGLLRTSPFVINNKLELLFIVLISLNRIRKEKKKLSKKVGKFSLFQKKSKL